MAHKLPPVVSAAPWHGIADPRFVSQDTQQSAPSEAEQMASALAGADTLQQLDALYLEWVGYSMLADAPETTATELRAVLADYLREVEAGEVLAEARAAGASFVSDPARPIPGDCNPGY